MPSAMSRIGAKVVGVEEIEEQDWTLNIARYVQPRSREIFLHRQKPLPDSKRRSSSVEPPRRAFMTCL